MTSVFSLFFSESRKNSFIEQLGAKLGLATLHYFPDQECCVQIHSEIKNQKVIIFDSLNEPNSKIIPLLFLAQTARDNGAIEVGLVTPYLSYMRQDKEFKQGQGVSAKYFAKLISSYFDWMVTIDPHLHRFYDLNEIYTIPNQTAHAGPLIASWIKDNIKKPILIGPDSESEQWLKAITKVTNIPYLILEKTRLGDRSVKISKPNLEGYQNCTPILVDDIISSGNTMIASINNINELMNVSPICIGIHGIFSEKCDAQISQCKVQDIITCNSIEHPTNKINIDQLLVEKINLLMRG